MISGRPPRLARWLLLRAVPGDARDAIDGDLLELYEERRSANGGWSANSWYWREAFSFGARFIVDRGGRLASAVVGRDGTPSALDFKLGGRMLMKYPGLAIVGGLGMAVATAIGAGMFAWLTTYLNPELPLRGGDRIVTIFNWDTRGRWQDDHVIHDFPTWRRELTTVADLGVFRTSRRNFVSPSGEGESIIVAEMSASGFRVAETPPLLGRTLLDDDERADAAPVIVIGYDVWQTRFAGDTGIVGRTMKLGRVVHTIVGVMPETFGFPISHSYWIPLRADPTPYEIGKGPELRVFGRLAPGVTKAQASAQLAVLGRRTAAAHPTTHAALQPMIGPYTDVFAGGGAEAVWIVTIIETIVMTLMLVVCTNVAILVYARTVARTGEIAVRTALGATRTRIVMQLFAEAFVLSVLSALLGLGLVAIALRYVDSVLGAGSPTGRMPFWIDPGLSIGTVVYTLALAAFAAVVVGVLPGLRATGAQLRSTLGALSGGSKPQLGRTWTLLIVTQVALTVAVLPVALLKGFGLYAQASQRPGFATETYLAAQVFLEHDGSVLSGGDLTTPKFTARVRAMQTTMLSRIVEEPGVEAVAFAEDIPGLNDEDVRMGLEGGDEVHVRPFRITATFFETFKVGLVAGRLFSASDAETPENRTIVVNRSFADEFFGGANVIGRRIRRGVTDAGESVWYTIVGVVEDFPTGFREPGRTNARAYFLARPADLQWGVVLVRLRGRATATAAFGQTLREIAADIDPELQLRGMGSLEGAYAERRNGMFLAVIGEVLVVGSVLLLSMAGMYALMSFTVNQRRREIGIRSALGADARRILTSILSSATQKLSIGVGVGLLLTTVVDRLLGGELLAGNALLLVPCVAAFMVAVGLIAAAGPARRGLRVQPTEALRSE